MMSIEKIFADNGFSLGSGVLLSPLTSFGVGGRAAFYLAVNSEKELIKAVALTRQAGLDHFVLAGGTNVVFGDGTVEKVVIHYDLDGEGIDSRIEINGCEMESEAGVPLAHLVRRTAALGLAGLESLAGIPGTVGGAVAGNAGAYGANISDRLTEVFIFDGCVCRWVPVSDLGFRYRYSRVKENNDWLVLRAKWRLDFGGRVELEETVRVIEKQRSEKYSGDLACPGSFFKNIPVDSLSSEISSSLRVVAGKIPAGYLLEQVGACGMSEGPIRVADWHGNLLINDGGGSFGQVRALSSRLKKKVKDHFGLKLEEEVVFVL